MVVYLRKALRQPPDFFLKMPLYEPFEYEGEEVWELAQLVLFFKGHYDSYCVHCKRESTFHGRTPETPSDLSPGAQEAYNNRLRLGPQALPEIPDALYVVTAVCARSHEHVQYFVFRVTKQALIAEKEGLKKLERHRFVTKIGQSPSFGDLALPHLKKYAGVLDETLLGELNRAVLLASHDVGVGSYVYLRRVFEALVERAHKAALKTQNWDEALYAKGRMSEKVVLLRDFLPEFVVENPEVYALLSRGIHELTEKECRDHFETLRLGIELILDQQLEREAREKKLKDAKGALSRAVSATSKTSQLKDAPE